PGAGATARLGQAFAAGAIKPGVTLRDLLVADGGPPDAFAGITVGDLHFWGNVTLKGLVDSFPDGKITLGDYFLLVLRSPTAQQGLAWERLSLAGSNLPGLAADAQTVPYRARFDVRPGPQGATGFTPVELDVTLPAGFLYVPGTSTIVQTPDTCPSEGAPSLADPSVTGPAAGPQKLSWTVQAVVGHTYSVCFDAHPGITLGPQAA